MKTKLIVILLLISFFYYFKVLKAGFFDYKGKGLNQGQISINEEGYKLKEVLKFNWGDSGDKISAEKTENSKIGPDLFAIDDKNNIYFNDPGKKRIIKYTLEGKTVFLNNLKNIASVFGDGYFLDKRGFIYNSEGEFLYRIESPVNLGNIIKAIQNKNTICIIYDSNQYIELKKDDIENKLNNGNKLIFSKEEFPKRILKGHPSSYFDYSYFVDNLETNNKIEICNGNNIIKELPLNITKEIDKNIQISSSIIGDDDKGNVYTFTVYSYSPWKRIITIRKYNKDGKLLLSIRGFDHWQDLEIVSEKTIFIDNKGNIYQLGVSEDAIRIYCWEK